MNFTLKIEDYPRPRVMILSKYRHYANALNQLGDHLFFKFLKDIFNEISASSRTGNISFSKYSEADLCISWDLKKNMEEEDFVHYLIDGIHKVNRLKNTYLKRYGFIALFHFSEEYQTYYKGSLKFKGKFLSNWYPVERDATIEEARHYILNNINNL